MMTRPNKIKAERVSPLRYIKIEMANTIDGARYLFIKNSILGVDGYIETSRLMIYTRQTIHAPE